MYHDNAVALQDWNTIDKTQNTKQSINPVYKDEMRNVDGKGLSICKILLVKIVAFFMGHQKQLVEAAR